MYLHGYATCLHESISLPDLALTKGHRKLKRGGKYEIAWRDSRRDAVLQRIILRPLENANVLQFKVHNLPMPL